MVWYMNIQTKWHVDNIKVTGYENFSEDIIFTTARTETKWHVDNIELNYEEPVEEEQKQQRRYNMKKQLHKMPPLRIQLLLRK